MEKLEIYNQAFTESFNINDEDLKNLKYQDIETWDSVGHMVLISSLEEKFDIMMEMDDIIDFSGYEKGKEILSKYDIKI